MKSFLDAPCGAVGSRIGIAAVPAVHGAKVSIRNSARALERDGIAALVVHEAPTEDEKRRRRPNVVKTALIFAARRSDVPPARTLSVQFRDERSG
jgi:hypothetical protein